MIKILTLCPNPKDSTSFYRGYGPLKKLAKKHQNVQVLSANGLPIDWAALMDVDILFLQRPNLKEHLQIMELAQGNGIPVWIDFDDDLFNVPLENPCHAQYEDMNVKKNIAVLIGKADFVTVSTQDLYDKFSKITNKIEVVRNAYDTDLFPYARDYAIPTPQRLISWRGSQTHDKDLLTFTPKMVEVAETDPSWNWFFIGNPFWMTLDMMSKAKGLKDNQVLHSKGLDPIEYFKFMWKVRPFVNIVPLCDNTFNRAKSNIAFLEATHAGSLTLAPDWEEWRVPGCINYSSPEDFKSKLLQILDGSINFEEEIFKARRTLLLDFELTQINKKRVAIIEELSKKEVV